MPRSQATMIDRCKTVMAWLHVQQPNNPQSLSTICQGTKYVYRSIQKTVKDDYPECFGTHPVYGGIILTGQYPNDDPFDLDELAEQKGYNERIASTIPQEVSKDKFERPMPKKFYDAGQQLIKDGGITPTMRKELEQMHASGKVFTLTDEMFARHYNMANAYLILLKVLQTNDRQKRFNQLVKD